MKHEDVNRSCSELELDTLEGVQGFRVQYCKGCGALRSEEWDERQKKKVWGEWNIPETTIAWGEYE